MSCRRQTPVLLRQNSGKTVHAAFQRVESLCGEPWAVIRFEKASKGAGREFINEAKAHRVSFSAGLDAEAKEDVIGRTANVRLGLAEGFIADDFAVRDLILCSVSECALIGVVKTLSDELCGREVWRTQPGRLNGIRDASGHCAGWQFSALERVLAIHAVCS